MGGDPGVEEVETGAPDAVAVGLVFSAAKPGPGTHVLVVGVGHYPYFKKGGPEAYDDAPLGQLSSSPVSARLMARWFIDEYDYPAAPLQSVALLVSDTTNVPFETASGSFVLTKPTYENFKVAAKAWHKRGSTDEGNRLVFLFCGHGYGYGEITSLLMADFDFREDDRWDNALDLGVFLGGMETCAAAEQVYFIDACRRPHPSFMSPAAAIGRSPFHITESPRDNFATTRNAPLFFSTGDAEPARGRTDGASVFTDAFLKSMRGMAARDDNGDWRVNNYSLLEALSHVSLRLTKEHFPEPQQPQGSQSRAFDFHYLSKDPVSPIYIERPGHACGPGQLHYSVHGIAMVRPCTADETEVEIPLPLGGYQFILTDGETILAKANGRSAPTFKKAKLS